MSKSGQMTFKILAGLILILLAFDALLAPMISYMLLQYPDMFEIMSPEAMFAYVVILEVIINGIIMFLVVMVNRRRKR